MRQKVEQQSQAHPGRRDLFLCHAWADRETVAQEFHDLLEDLHVSVWFSQKDVALGTSLLRAIDKGLRLSRVGIVLVTPELLKSIEKEGIADKELSALLATDRVIPVAHGTTFEALRDVSPLLAARSGLTTGPTLPLSDIAAKVAETVRL
ncbi:TIR domain-containing protein [Agrococcus sp. KRD186]|uniref:TIR domain-containing protein n=1 Tax=Agrococcus sp. KRD186 TaxID=2729730 RepID=UPI0019CFCA06